MSFHLGPSPGRCYVNFSGSVVYIMDLSLPFGTPWKIIGKIPPSNFCAGT